MIMDVKCISDTIILPNGKSAPVSLLHTGFCTFFPGMVSFDGPVCVLLQCPDESSDGM